MKPHVHTQRAFECTWWHCKFFMINSSHLRCQTFPDLQLPTIQLCKPECGNGGCLIGLGTYYKAGSHASVAQVADTFTHARKRPNLAISPLCAGSLNSVLPYSGADLGVSWRREKRGKKKLCCTGKTLPMHHRISLIKLFQQDQFLLRQEKTWTLIILGLK